MAVLKTIGNFRSHWNGWHRWRWSRHSSRRRSAMVLFSTSCFVGYWMGRVEHASPCVLDVEQNGSLFKQTDGQYRRPTFSRGSITLFKKKWYRSFFFVQEMGSTNETLLNNLSSIFRSKTLLIYHHFKSSRGVSLGCFFFEAQISSPFFFFFFRFSEHHFHNFKSLSGNSLIFQIFHLFSILVGVCFVEMYMSIVL